MATFGDIARVVVCSSRNFIFSLEFVISYIFVGSSASCSSRSNVISR